MFGVLALGRLKLPQQVFGFTYGLATHFHSGDQRPLARYAFRALPNVALRHFQRGFAAGLQADHSRIQPSRLLVLLANPGRQEPARLGGRTGSGECSTDPQTAPRLATRAARPNPLSVGRFH